MVVPSSDIILLKTPFEIDEENELTFSSRSAQENYFLSLPHLRYDDCTYQRKDGVIRYKTDLNLTYESLLQYNYCMYRNDNYSNKWFYAFITGIRYVNDGMSEISIETDVFQTWQFDIVYKRSFIEREHVNNDTIGKHTVPENLEHGPYINAKAKTDFNYMSDTYIVIGLNKPFISGARNYNYYNGVYSGIIYYLFKDTDTPNHTKEEHANAFLSQLDDDGHGDYIESIFLIPSNFAPNNLIHAVLFDGYVCYRLDNSNSAYDMGNVTLTRPTHVGNSYVPKNNKLFCYPYNSIIVSNNAGTSAEYHYEDFNSISDIKFKIYGTISPGCSIKAIPLNFKGITSNIEESINGAKIPVCSCSSDSYTNWLTQNSVNNAVGFASSGINLIGSALTGNVGGAISGALGIGSKLGEIYQHSFAPNQAKGNTNSSDVVYSTGNSDFNAYYMTIKDEYAKIIDDYFSMFGYKVNDVKLPNITGRTNWNYVKAIDINLIGNIPQEDLQKIRDIFNKGCTFWHNPNTFLDYSQTNAIV